MSFKTPKGRRPKFIAEFLNFEMNGKKIYDGCEIMLICPTCEKWVTEIDHYFPYHSEMNKCADCGYFKNQTTKKKKVK